MARGRLLAPALAAASGLAILAAHPPLRWWWTSFLAAPLLLAALTVDARATAASRPGTRAFGLGVVVGVAAFAPMLTWVIQAVAHPTASRAVGVLGWALLVLVQAGWMGVLAVVVRPVLHHAALPFVAAMAWTGVDAWRSIVPMNGFEWGAIAYAHVEGSWLLPVARLAGGRAITLLVVLVSAAAFVAVQRTWHAVRERGDTPVDVALARTRGPAAVLIVGLLLSVLATIDPPPETGSLDVLVVQGNDVRHWEDDVIDPDPPLRIATDMRDLTLAAVEDGGRPDLTVWPESSIDRDPSTERGRPLRERADEAATAAGRLLAGTTLSGPDPATQRLVAGLVLDDGFDETDRYVKRRLVPFGEYVPMRPLLGWFPPLDALPRDAVAGPADQVVEVVDGVHAAVVICFETLFTDIVRTNVLAGEEPADVIVTLTNDASFGLTSEPWQHLAQARLRAVETGRWVVYGALTGSSAFVDPDGRAHQQTPLFEHATIRADVPLVQGQTPYLVVGDVVGWTTRAAVVALAVLALVLAWRRRTAAPADDAGAATPRSRTEDAGAATPRGREDSNR